MMTMEPGRYVKAKELLEGQGIPFTVKTESATRQIGRMGENMNYNVIYRIFTDKKEADRAEFVLNNGLRGI